MRKFILLFYVLSIISIFTLSAQKWPGVDYKYAMAYMYNLENKLMGQHAIVKSYKLDSTTILPGKKLNFIQIKKILNLTKNDLGGLLEGFSKSYIPHHAIVFYDEDNIPVAYLTFCFDCEAIRSYPILEYKPIKSELSEKAIKKQQKYLNEFKEIFLDLEFPVFDNPFEYKKLVSYSELEFIDGKHVYQIIENEHPDSKKRFDLSGMVKTNKYIYAIADKKWNNHIYLIDTCAKGFTIKNAFELPKLDNDVDIEGIDYNKGVFYLIEETFTRLFTLNTKDSVFSEININWENFGIDLSEWGAKNKGLEGLAFDKDKNVIYFMKEREPRRIYEYDIEKKLLNTPFDEIINPDNKGDISDAKYANGYIYLLERANYCVKRINVVTKDVVVWSFKKSLTRGKEKTYNAKFGMAEALLLTDNEIWIGLDNNGDQVTEFGVQQGLNEGNAAAIFIFKRPKDF